MNSEEQIVQEKAVLFAKENKKRIAKEFTDISTYVSDNAPVSVFMSGSPGAGKTELAKRILEILEQDHNKVVHIDPDMLRNYFKDYDGTNSFLFQGAVSILVDKIHDCVLENNQNFIFDSTLSDFKRAKQNIKRSLDKGRLVEIFFIYQKPELAWQFAREREKKEGRMVPKDAFISHFLSSQNVVNSLKEVFGKKIQVNVVIKNIDNSDLAYIENVVKIDSYLPQKYTQQQLEDILK